MRSDARVWLALSLSLVVLTCSSDAVTGPTAASL